MSIFKGSGVAIVTPFDQDSNPDYNRLGQLIDFQIQNQTDCIVICGTTGEASTLTDDEQLRVIQFAVEHTAGRLPVIAGTGSNDTRHGIDLSVKASKLGVDGLLHVTPYYNKTTQKGMIEHFTAIAKAVEVPIVLYNVPSRTNLNILPKTVAQLAKIDNIVAIKEASGNMGQIAQIADLTNGTLDIYSGNDNEILPILALGGIGVISAVANIIPKECHDLVADFLAGDLVSSRKQQLAILDLVDAVFCEVSPIPVKAALSLMGGNFDAGICRAPLTTMEPENLERLRQAMITYGLITG